MWVVTASFPVRWDMTKIKYSHRRTPDKIYRLWVVPVILVVSFANLKLTSWQSRSLTDSQQTTITHEWKLSPALNRCTFAEVKPRKVSETRVRNPMNYKYSSSPQQQSKLHDSWIQLCFSPTWLCPVTLGSMNAFFKTAHTLESWDCCFGFNASTSKELLGMSKTFLVQSSGGGKAP